MTGYIIEKKEGSGSRWFKANLTNVSDTRFSVTGLNQDETYEFRVMAKNAVGSLSNPSMTAGPVTCVDTYGRWCFSLLSFVPNVMSFAFSIFSNVTLRVILFIQVPQRLKYPRSISMRSNTGPNQMLSSSSTS